MNNRPLRRALSQIPAYLLLSAVSFLIVIPFYWMVSTSLKQPAKVLDFPPQWIPSPVMWGNYLELFQVQPFHLYFGNSLYIAVLVTAGTCIISAMAGYAFAKLYFPLKSFIFMMLLSSMMIPSEVTAIPMFVWMSSLGWVDTHLPLIIPTILGGMFGVFLMRQFFITIPHDLDDAARIDGCNPWGSFLRVMLPLSGPALATLSILTFLGSWNEFFDPLIYLNSSRLYTLPLALSLFTDQGGTQWHLVMTASVISTLPLLIVFFFAQRRFIEGITMTGVK